MAEEYKNGQIMHNKELKFTEAEVDEKLLSLVNDVKDVREELRLWVETIYSDIDKLVFKFKLIFGGILLVLIGIGLGLLISYIRR